MTSVTAMDTKFDLAAAPMRIGRVRLQVSDLSRVADFYQDVLGLVATDTGPDRVTLGAGATPLLELTRKPGLTPRDRRAAGLFHTAFLLPQRADLGRWLAHARKSGVKLQGASDHIVSEAIYLSDPEGNGVEVYADRPVSAWTKASGEIAMATEPLDIPSLLQAGAGADWAGAPAGTVVGHIHLQAGDTKTAEAFWQDILGFDLMARYPDASFFGSGGYHHQVAANVWNSRGAGAVPDDMAGLAGFEILANDPAQLTAVADRAEAAGRLLSRSADSVLLGDPWNIRITLAA